MTTIDFYILAETSGQKSWLFACGLLEKAYAEKQRVYIHTHSIEEAERIDAFLWTYRDDSFLPHQLCTAASDCPIVIGAGEYYAGDNRELLLNLSSHVPPFYYQFQRIIEIIFNDAIVQQLGRERYKYYRNEKCEINTYK